MHVQRRFQFTTTFGIEGNSNNNNFFSAMRFRPILKAITCRTVQSNPTIKETTSTAVNSSSPQVLPIQIIAQNVQNSTGNWLLFYASDDGKQDPAIARAKLFDISKVPDHSPVSYKINLASDHISKGTTIRACVISMDDPIDLASIHCNKQVFNGTSNQPLPFLIHLPNR